MKKYLWVVEMKIDGFFEPTVGVGICRYDGREKLQDCKDRNPDDKFRLVKYVREDKP